MRITSMNEKRDGAGKRLLWFGAIWLASVVVLFVFAYSVRTALGL